MKPLVRSLGRARRSSAGFTLVELMVTLSISAILVTVAVPNMIDLIRDARLATQSDALVSSLNLARLEAIKQGRSFSVCPVATASGCTAGVQTWATGWVIYGNGAVSQTVGTKTGLSVTAVFDSVVFGSTLGSAVTARQFTLCVTGRKEHVVNVSLSGHVSKRIGTTTCL